MRKILKWKTGHVGANALKNSEFGSNQSRDTTQKVMSGGINQ
jgi:hypothetical protein